MKTGPYGHGAGKSFRFGHISYIHIKYKPQIPYRQYKKTRILHFYVSTVFGVFIHFPLVHFCPSAAVKTEHGKAQANTKLLSDFR